MKQTCAPGCLEVLESRIAPASLTFTDLDGDDVVITASGSGALTLGGNVIVSNVIGSQTQIFTLDLTDAAFQGANVSIIAKRNPTTGGDGLVNVGLIDATGRDLGKVIVDGDLGQLLAGDNAKPAPGLASLTVGSLGRFSTSTGATSLIVGVTGKMGALSVRGDIVLTQISAESMGGVTIGGSLIGGGADATGSIVSAGAIGAVKIAGSIVGGSGADTGKIFTTGAIASLKIGLNVDGGPANFAGGVFAGSIGSVTVGGSLIGADSGQQSGVISTTGAMGAVKIGGNLEGGVAPFSGLINSGKTITSVTVGGSLIGLGQDSGEILATGSIGAVKIGGSVLGSTIDGAAGSESGSGAIRSSNDIASVSIGGSLVGGIAVDSGTIAVGGTLGAVKIGGDLRGSDANATGNLFRTGYIAAKRIGAVFVGGSIIAGVEGAGGNLFTSGAIVSENDIGAITVKGSLIGNGSVPVQIIARGQLAPSGGTDLAIKSLTVGGRVERADILAGYTIPGSLVPATGVNADAQIGPVVVGDWFASNLAAGVQDNFDAERSDFFGEGDDLRIAGGSDKIVSKIASILIKGQALGTPRVNQGTGIDHFGFVAQQIGSFKIGNSAFTLNPGAGTDLLGVLVSATGDLRFREVAV